MSSPLKGGDRRPYEDMEELVQRLEKERLQTVANHRLKEAEALEEVVEAARESGEYIGAALPVEAKAKRAYAEEMMRAIEEMAAVADERKANKEGESGN